jgi:hypothetical protein
VAGRLSGLVELLLARELLDRHPVGCGGFRETVVPSSDE